METTTAHYHVGHNIPGYLPDGEPDTCETLADAHASLLWELEAVVDYLGEADMDPGHDCDDIPCPTYGDNCPWDTYQDALNTIDEVKRAGPAVRYAGVGNEVYWIESCFEPDCLDLLDD